MPNPYMLGGERKEDAESFPHQAAALDRSRKRMKFIAVLLFISCGIPAPAVTGIIITRLPNWLSGRDLSEDGAFWDVMQWEWGGMELRNILLLAVLLWVAGLWALVLLGEATKAQTSSVNGTVVDLSKTLNRLQFFHRMTGFPGVVVISIIIAAGKMTYDRFHDPRQYVSSVTGNLRQLMSAANQYMQDHHVTSATYTDLVGPGTTYQLHIMAPRAGEDYTTLVISQTATQITISSAALGTVTYSQ